MSTLYLSPVQSNKVNIEQLLSLVQQQMRQIDLSKLHQLWESESNEGELDISKIKLLPKRCEVMGSSIPG